MQLEMDLQRYSIVISLDYLVTFISSELDPYSKPRRGCGCFGIISQADPYPKWFESKNKINCNLQYAKSLYFLLWYLGSFMVFRIFGCLSELVELKDIFQ